MPFLLDQVKFPKTFLIPCSVEIKAHSSTSENSLAVYGLMVTSSPEILFLQITDYGTYCFPGMWFLSHALFN